MTRFADWKNAMYLMMNRSFFSNDLTQSQLEDMRPLMEQWRSLMNKEQADGLCSQIQAFLEQAVHDKKMNGQWLEIFCHNLIQMVYAVLAGRDILAEQLLKDIEPTMEEALESVGADAFICCTAHPGGCGLHEQCGT